MQRAEDAEVKEAPAVSACRAGRRMRPPPTRKPVHTPWEGCVGTLHPMAHDAHWLPMPVATSQANERVIKLSAKQMGGSESSAPPFKATFDDGHDDGGGNQRREEADQSCAA